MLGLVETLVGRTLGSLRGLGRGLGCQKLLNCDNCSVSARCPGIYKKYHRPQDWINSMEHWIDSVMNRCNTESIQLSLPFLPSSFAYTHPFELGVGPLGSWLLASIKDWSLLLTLSKWINSWLNRFTIESIHNWIDSMALESIQSWGRLYFL